MSYNQYNNDLPTPPKGWSTWRAAYAAMLNHLSNYEGGLPPIEATAHFIHSAGEPRVGEDELPVFEVPYWKMAHYAAREQAEEDQRRPRFDFRQWMALYQAVRASPMPVSHEIEQWLRANIDDTRP